MREGMFTRSRKIVDEGLFSNEDMEIAVAAMQEAYRHSRAEFDLSQELREKIDAFVTNFLLGYQVGSITMPSSLDTLVREVFGNKTVRDFVMTLQYNFFARWGEGLVNFTSLADNLSCGIGLDSGDDIGYCLVPKQLLDSVPNSENSCKILRANKWLVTLLVMKTAVTVPIKQPN